MQWTETELNIDAVVPASADPNEPSPKPPNAPPIQPAAATAPRPAARPPESRNHSRKTSDFGTFFQAMEDAKDGRLGAPFFAEDPLATAPPKGRGRSDARGGSIAPKNIAPRAEAAVQAPNGGLDVPGSRRNSREMAHSRRASESSPKRLFPVKRSESVIGQLVEEFTRVSHTQERRLNDVRMHLSEVKRMKKGFAAKFADTMSGLRAELSRMTGGVVTT